MTRGQMSILKERTMENYLRDEVLQRVLDSKKSAMVLELATSFGKSRIALEKLRRLCTPSSKILIVIPRRVLIQNWKKEFVKWGYADMLGNVTFTTYISFPLHAGFWDVIVYDEAHHLSQRCRDSMPAVNSKYSIYLSATLKRDVRYFLRNHHDGNIEFITVSTKKAIEGNVLPDPKILLVPLELDLKRHDILYEKKKPRHGEKPLVIPYRQKWKYKDYKGALYYMCSQRQYYNELSGLIEWYRGKNFNPAMRKIWLHKCGERLQWLSMTKLPYTKEIIGKVHSRFVVFCNTIAESSALHMPAVNSLIGFHNLDRFNDKEIDSLVAVNCLNEGVNLVDCKVGVFNAINASEVMQVQKVGRELRHKEPVIIIPYFKNTREDEIVSKWMQGFDPSLITTKSIEEL